MSAEMATIRENPFSNSTDPRLAYFDKPRRNAVARLLTGLYQGDGLFLLVGEDGIGKTTLLRHLGIQIAALAGVRLLHAEPFVSCPASAGFIDVAKACAGAIADTGGDPLEMARLLQDIAADGDQMPAMLIDDADRLDDAGLRAIATLTTLRSGERRLLSAVMVGSRELPRRMARVSGTAENVPAERIIQVPAMARAEVERMIRQRLRLAGRSDLEEVLQPAIGELAGQGNGVPLQVLGLCRRALGSAETLAPRLSLSKVTDEAPLLSLGDSIPTVPLIVPAAAEVSADGAAMLQSAGNAPSHRQGAGPEAPAQGAGDEMSAEALRPSAESTAVPPPPFKSEATSAWAGIGATSGNDPSVSWERGEAASHPARGHIRYTAASARRVDTARWQNAGRRRRPWRKMSLAAGSLLVMLGAGWAVYDFVPRENSDPVSSTAAVIDPLLAPSVPAGLAPPVLPRPDATTAPPFAVTTPALPAPSSTDSWWRPQASAERSGDDHRPDAASGTSAGASAPPADVVNRAAVDSLEGASLPEESPWVASGPTVTAPAREPEPPAPVIAAKPVPKAAPPATASNARSVAVSTAPEKPPAPEVLSASASADGRGQPARTRQKEALLLEGDEQLLAGQVDAARAIYQEAFDRGSAEAARRLAQTFDPRNVAATSTDGSAAEAILWYKDAARHGDRRARGELEALENWLEDAAASGDAEARRVLQVWRAPAEPVQAEP